MVVVKKLMLESLLNIRFRETILNHEELLIALGKLSQQPERRQLARALQWTSGWRRRMTAKVETGESWTLHFKAVYKGTEGPDRLRAGSHRGSQVARMRIVEEIIAGRKGDGKKGGEGTETGRKGDNNSTCWTCGKSRHIAASCPNGGNDNLFAVGREESEISE